MSAPDELVVFSHLRWIWVWQRPHHLVSRLAAGRRTLFVEEPVAVGAPTPTVCSEEHPGIERVWLETTDTAGDPMFDHPQAPRFAELRNRLDPAAHRTVWLYTPLALPLARALDPSLIVYDVMDDLASFNDASPLLRRLQDETLEEADVVFAGGRSLYEGIRDRAAGKAFPFPSGVEPEHYARARAARRDRERPVAGYVGVVDERIDLELVAGLAERLPDWDIEMVGPSTKIDPASLPVAPNIRYPGLVPYDRLPEVMAGFDVALMPFALNEATRSISPTKTLEYLAAGLPVVSTRVRDVVSDFRGVVALEDDAEGFADACRRTLRDRLTDRDRKVRPLLHLHHWDTIAARMDALMGRARAGEPLVDQVPPPPDDAPARRAGAVA